MYIDDLKSLKIWIPYMIDEGKKPSLDGIRYAKWSDKSLWKTYDDAMTLLKATPALSGLGFVVPEGITVIDLDHCYDEAGKLNSVAARLVYQFHSYTERSPSGKGLHIIVQNGLKDYKKAAIKIQDQSVEIITSGNNFVTYTGDNINHKVEWIGKSDDIILRIYNRNEIKPRSMVPQVPIDKVWKHEIGLQDGTSYGRKALAGECDKIRQAYEGSRTETLLTAAFKIGQLIPDGHISEHEAIRELSAAAMGFRAYSRGKIEKTIDKGLSDGMSLPRHVECHH